MQEQQADKLRIRQHQFYNHRRVGYRLTIRERNPNLSVFEITKADHIARELNDAGSRSAPPQIALVLLLAELYASNWRVRANGSMDLSRFINAKFQDSNIPENMLYSPDGYAVEVDEDLRIKNNKNIFRESKSAVRLKEFFDNMDLTKVRYIANFIKLVNENVEKVREIYAIRGNLINTFGEVESKEPFFEIRLFMNNGSFLVFRKSPVYQDRGVASRYGLTCSYGATAIFKRVHLNRMETGRRSEIMNQLDDGIQKDILCSQDIQNSMQDTVHTITSNKELMELV